MKAAPLVLLILLTGSLVLPGQSKSSSANYDLLSAPLGLGGGSVGNGSNLTAQISIGDASSGTVSNLTAGGVQVKPNYIGQLYDVLSVALDAVPTTVDELSTRQLSAIATMDDLTTLPLSATDMQWAVVLGPLTGVAAGGLATADAVFQNTLATVEGTFQGVSGQLGLTVLDIEPDNFGSYSGDGLPDGWQVTFFGPPPNPEADPGENPDQDPHDNEFEFLTGYDPTDSGDFFTLEVVGLTGNTSTLQLSKIIPGTRYRIERSLDLQQSDPWSEFANFTTLSEIFSHQLNDPNAIGVRWFYRVGVEPE